MAVFASFWWVYLIIFAVCLGYALFNQVRRMQGMAGSMKRGATTDPFSSFGKGLGALAAAGGVAMISGLCLAISVLYLVTH